MRPKLCIASCTEFAAFVFAHRCTLAIVEYAIENSRSLAARCSSFCRQVCIKGSCNLRKLLLLSYCAAGNASAAVVCAAQCRHACIKGSCNLVSTAPATRTITRLSQVCADGSPLLTRQVLVSCCGGCGAPVCGGTCQLFWGLWCPCL